MNKPILSICIPTYNGADSLKQTLEGIVSQFDNLEVKRAVEVVISDNASTDDTADIVKIFQERFDNVKYFKNKENIGFDLNLLNAIKKSKGEYCWMFNDNTVIKTSALAYLLQKLRGECNVYLISGFETVGQKTYDGNELLDNYGLFGGKLDRVILKRDKIPNAEKYIGNLWVHYSLVLEMAIVGKVGVLRELTIPDSTRLSKWASKNGQGFIAFVNLKKIVSHCRDMGYDPKVINKIERQFLLASPKTLISAKLYGLKVNYNNFLLLLQFPLFFPLLLVIFLTPSFVFKFLKLIKVTLYGLF